MWFCCDLHVHSKYSSDCRVEPADIVSAAAKRGVRVVAVTDHHSLQAYPEARRAGRVAGVAVLPGVELSCPSGRSGVHVLGIFPPRLDVAQATLALELEVAGLGDAGGSVPYDVVEAVRRIQELGGLAIAAHALSAKGLLEECRGQVREWVLGNASFDGIEINASRNLHRPIRLPLQLREVAVVCGSDAHHLADDVEPGRPYGVGARPFWADGPAANFSGLRFALSAPPGVESVPAFANLSGRRRVDQLLRLGDHHVRVVFNDAPSRREQIITAAIELLNGDGGFLLVGLRRRFQGATRGASLQLTLGELHDLIVDNVFPSPVVRLRRHRAAHGFIHELSFLSSENVGQLYERHDREEVRRAARGTRTALEQLGAFDARAMASQLRARADRGILGLSELITLWPYRYWFDNDKEVARMVGEGLATRLVEDSRTPRWLRLWAKEHGDTRRRFRDAYRSLARRAATVDHRERLREALANSVARGTLAPGQRSGIEKWFERTQSELLAGEPSFDVPSDDLAELRERAALVFGESLRSELDTEAERAEAQYRAAMQEAFGAHASVVLEMSAGSEQPVTLHDLTSLGIDQVIVDGAGASTTSTGSVVVVPDRLSSLFAPQLLELWAQTELPSADVLPGVIRRCVESGKHLPVLRFGAALDRDELQKAMDGLEEVGATQLRNSILGDLAELLQPSQAAGADEANDVAIVEGLARGLSADRLKVAAEVATESPQLVRDFLGRNPTTLAAIRRAARPLEKLTIRRPAIVLAGAANDRALLADWPNEANPHVRLSLVEGISLLEADSEVDAVLFEALASKAGLIARASRALAARGASGYEILSERLPADERGRQYLVDGVVPLSHREPALARELAYLACMDASGGVLSSVRWMDHHLHFR